VRTKQLSMLGLLVASALTLGASAPNEPVAASAGGARFPILRVHPAGQRPISPLVPIFAPNDPSDPICVVQGLPFPCITPPHVNYFGGKVISNVKVYAVMWTNKVVAASQTGLPGFYTAVANSDYIDFNNEYNTFRNAEEGSHKGQAGTNQVIGRGAYAGAYVLTPKTATGTSITNGDIIKELTAALDAGELPPPDANTIYMTHYPPGYSISLDANTRSCEVFCAYHFTFLYKGASTYYGVVPDFTQGACAQGCGSGNAFQNTCSASSHELIEAVTDAEVGLLPLTSTTNDFPEAYQDDASGEVGDMCALSDGTIVSIADGKTYTVQQTYSNTTGLCHTTRHDATDFKVFFNPNTVTLQAGSPAVVDVPVQTATTNGAAQSLALSVSGFPAGITATLSAATVTSGANAVLHLSAAGATTAIKDAIGAVVASGATKHSAGLLVQVTAPQGGPDDFSIAAAPATVQVARGATAGVTVSTAVTKGNAEAIALSDTGLPAGVTGTFKPPSVNAGATSALGLVAAANAALGTATVTVTGTATSGAHSTTFKLTVVDNGGGSDAGTDGGRDGGGADAGGDGGAADAGGGGGGDGGVGDDAGTGGSGDGGLDTDAGENGGDPGGANDGNGGIAGGDAGDGGNGANGGTGDTSGCGCSVIGAPGAGLGWLGAAIGLAAIAARRRRRN